MKNIFIKTTARVCVLIAVLFVFCPLQSQATVALDFIPSDPGTIQGADATFGWSFSLSSPVLLTDLGFWDGSASLSNGDGLADAHILTVWTSTGTPLVQATISAGGSGTFVGDFRYVSVAPTLLLAGDYVIGAYSPNGQDPYAWDTDPPTTAPGVLYTGGRFGNGNAFLPGDGFSFLSGNAYFGPNFQFTEAPTIAVPEPSTWTLLLLGVTATFGLKFFVRRSA